MFGKRQLKWHTPEELVTLGLARSRVVLLNEAHDGWKRSPRTRAIGRRVLPAAHAAGVRDLAMEALDDEYAARANAAGALPPDGQVYLGQADMQALVADALALGWTLHPYEARASAWLSERMGAELPADAAPEAVQALYAKYQAELLNQDYTNWREEQQARRLVAVLRLLPAAAPLLVWCGNGHLYKRPLGDWRPMGWQLARLGGLEPFAIDQAFSVDFDSSERGFGQRLARKYRAELEARGGTAGLLLGALPRWRRPGSGVDAVLLSTDNSMA